MEVKPAPIVTNQLEKKIIFKSRNYDILSNKNHNIEIKISKNVNNLIFEGKYKNSIQSNIYISKKTLVEIKKNKYFLMFDNLNEIYDEIINLIQNNNPSLIEEKNKLLISIPLSTTKIKEIILEISKKEKTEKEKIEDLYLMINNLKSSYNKQINELNKIIDKLKNIINNKIENQNNKMKELNEKIKEQNEQIIK